MSDEKTELCDEMDFYPIFWGERIKWQYDTIIENLCFPLFSFSHPTVDFNPFIPFSNPTDCNWAIGVSVILSFEDPRIDSGHLCETKVATGPTPLKHE